MIRSEVKVGFVVNRAMQVGACLKVCLRGHLKRKSQISDDRRCLT